MLKFEEDCFDSHSLECYVRVTRETGYSCRIGYEGIKAFKEFGLGVQGYAAVVISNLECSTIHHDHLTPFERWQVLVVCECVDRKENWREKINKEPLIEMDDLDE